MYLKIMSDEDKADSDPSKGFRIIECQEVEYYKVEKLSMYLSNQEVNIPSCMIMLVDKTKEYELTGNAYLMNENGKTISSFAANPLQPREVRITKKPPKPQMPAGREVKEHVDPKS